MFDPQDVSSLSPSNLGMSYKVVSPIMFVYNQPSTLSHSDYAKHKTWPQQKSIVPLLICGFHYLRPFRSPVVLLRY